MEAPRFRYTRSVRTESSELYIIWEDEERVGQVDVHYAGETIYATVILEADFSVASEQEMLAQFDNDVVVSYLPIYQRADFQVSVYRGEEISSYSDSAGALDGEDDEEE
jgi:hypothetical protein